MNGEQITIRSATPADVSRIVELWEEFMAFHAEREPYLTPAPGGAECFDKHIAEKLADETWAIFVAELGGNAAASIVGYCVLNEAENPPTLLTRKYGKIGDCAVAAAHRRKGVGAALARAAIDWFSSRGLDCARLHAVCANEVSNAFWQAQGFRPYMTLYSLPIGEQQGD